MNIQEKTIPDLIYRLMSQLSPVVSSFIDSLSDDEVNELFDWARDSENIVSELQKVFRRPIQ